MAKSKKEKKELKFELFEKLKNQDSSLLNDLNGWLTPDYIVKNLNHNLRYYQRDAIRYLHYTQKSEYFSFEKINQVMFNMATGSGKTDLMAGIILYLFKEKGYQNFLFTVNTNGVLSKTIDNLINEQSQKYLFKKNIEIDGERIRIRQVQNKFPKHTNKNEIYIRFISIQGLTNELFTKAENIMSLKDYSSFKMVILADEAHHYSASTKTKNKTEVENASWEKTLTELKEINSENLLLEFSATLDFDDNTIYQKYQKKILYRYTLDSYIKDKYSKNVRRIQTGNSNEENMLSTVLLSEYRRKYAFETLGIEIKPVILFKSHKIDASNEANKQFNNLIEGLSTESLKEFLERQYRAISDDSSHTLHLAFKYYLSQENLDVIVREIKRGFAPTRILNANDNDSNSKGLLDSGQYQALNSLEAPTNLYRVVFAVAKLTEGWDVLNLYDIVRINNLGSKTDKHDIKSTNSEAQLIGRGARYNPFTLKGETSYQRRFDEGDEISSLLLETLHYHTLNEPQYIKNLLTSLNNMNLATEGDKKNPLLDIKLKQSFKKTTLYKTGKIYYNETKEIPESFYTNFLTYGINIEKLSNIRHLTATHESAYSEQSQIELKSVRLKDIDIRFFKKSMSRSSFFHFNNLKKFLPNLKSKEDFFGRDWLDIENLTLYLETEKESQVENLTANEKLKIVDLFFENLASKIKVGFRKEKGTKKFVGLPISDYITDYRKRVPNYDTANNNTSINQHVVNRAFDKYNFFVYESAIINDLEERLVDSIANHISELEKKYGEVFLIRMDENMLKGTDKNESLKLHQFEPAPREINYSGFQPDFILLLKNQEYYLQIFIEPKGENIYEKDRWKEEILDYINEHPKDIEFEDEVDGVVIKGLKFYRYSTKDEVINQLSQLTLNKNRFSGSVTIDLF